MLDRRRQVKPIGVLLSVAIAYWDRTTSRADNMKLYSPSIPLLGLPQAGRGPRLTERQLPGWEEAGVQIVGDCFRDRELLPMADFLEYHELPAGQFLNHHKIRDAMIEL